MNLPAAAQWVADAQWKRIDFISDLHLTAEMPKTFDAWATYMAGTAADAIVLLGDLFEVWVGDDARFDEFEARCAEVLKLAAQKRTIAFMAGNRDFLVGGEMLTACGVKHLDDPTLLQAFGERWLLSHGDALCIDDVDYQRFRQMVRSAEWQQQFLAKPLEARRQYAREVRTESQRRKTESSSPAEWADVDAKAAASVLGEAQSRILIHGHTHRPGSAALPHGLVRHVLSDWDLDVPPQRAEVFCLSLAGVQRMTLREAIA